MLVTLELEDDVMAAARRFADEQGRSLGAVISDLARRGLAASRPEISGTLPFIRAPEGSPPITPEMVRRGLDED
jgi:hypothetical protein